jgi:ATP-dependent Clp protease ATP-binding subunit ClpA
MQFSDVTRLLAGNARRIALSRGHRQTGTLHLLYAFLTRGDGLSPAVRWMREEQVPVDTLATSLDAALSTPERRGLRRPGRPTWEAARVIRRAVSSKRASGSSTVDSSEVFLAMVADARTRAAQCLRENGIEPKTLAARIAERRRQEWDGPTEPNTSK